MLLIFILEVVAGILAFVYSDQVSQIDAPSPPPPPEMSVE